jgi:hypothetical protein
MADRCKLLYVLAQPDDETPGCAEMSHNVPSRSLAQELPCSSEFFSSV